MLFRIICLIFILYCPDIFAPGIQLKEGNLAFPTSQMPSPLFSLGQNIVDKKDFLILETLDYNHGKEENYLLISNSLLYGITDDIAILGVIPFVWFEEGHSTSAGLGDILLQGEWAFYNKDRWRYSDQATFIANITLPSGTTTPHRPNLGFGNVSFLLGGTFSHLDRDWYSFISGGVVMPLAKDGTHFGNQFYYEGGLARRITNTTNWLFDLLVEFNGIFFTTTKLEGVLQPDSKGNVIFLGPSLYAASYDHLIFITGIQGAFAQTLRGVYNFSFRYSLYGAWKF